MRTHEILLIDDDPVNNFINSKVVKSEFPDIPTTILENGLKALEYIREKPQRSYLVFLDINMPEMNGWEFLEAISQDATQYDLQIHILTSSIDHSDKMKAQGNEQVLSYLPKPLKVGMLKSLDGH